MSYLRILLSFFYLACSAGLLRAQEPIPANSDTTTQIHILSNTRKLTFQTVDDSTRLTIVTGNVKLRQNTTLIYCDSCVINSRTNVFEAWGRVHINDADTADIYSNHLLYLGQEKKAYLDGNVRLTDGKGTLTTPDLEYDMETNIGVYKKGGKVVNGKTVLTSRQGWYYADLKDVFFKGNVVLKDPAYNIVTDSLQYNTATQDTRFISRTLITDSSGVTIETREGYYNQRTGQAEFGLRPIIRDGKRRFITGDNILQNDSIYQALGNAIIIDSAQGFTIIGGLIFQNKNTEAILATRKPLMIIKQNNDSLYVAADTLFSARLTDRFGVDSVVVDTIRNIRVASINEKDSANRYFEAYRNVRIFNDSLQSICDSLYYSFKDSVFRLYYNPVVWAQQSQITGDTIHLFTKNKKADRVEAFENAFMINQVQGEAYNQIKSSRMDGWFLDGNIDSVRARGFAECIYYIQDADSAFTGVNQSTSDIIDIYFREKALDRVVFRSSVTGTIWPIKQRTPGELRLQNFRWLEDKRPKSKFELFE